MVLVGNAHLIAGGESSVGQLLALLKKEGYEIEANPDLYVRTYTHFGIDDARELRDRAQLSAVRGQRIFIVVAPSMTTEAQNALLKTLEEAPGQSLFLLVVANPHALLSTLRSRTQILTLPYIAGDEAKEVVDASAFLAANPADRLLMLKPLLEKGGDDRRDFSGILTFLSSIESHISRMGGKERGEGLASIYRARKYLSDKGSLVKPLLEQVALLVPVIK